VELDQEPSGIAVGFGWLWVAHGLLGAVSRVAPDYPGRTTIDIQQYPGGSGALGSITIGADSVWAAFGDSSVVRIDPARPRVVATLIGGNSPSAIAYGERSVWVTNARDNDVTRINPVTDGTYGQEPSAGLRPVAITVGGGTVWVSSTGDDSVWPIDPSTNSPKPSIPVGQEPWGIFYGAGAVWVANSADGTVSRIDPVTGRVVKTIHVGNSPRAIVFFAGKVWVTVRAS
jgi:YVTN family beta-propeller protein